VVHYWRKRKFASTILPPRQRAKRDVPLDA
jgi:hypothetical protein